MPPASFLSLVPPRLPRYWESPTELPASLYLNSMPGKAAIPRHKDFLPTLWHSMGPRDRAALPEQLHGGGLRVSRAQSNTSDDRSESCLGSFTFNSLGLNCPRHTLLPSQRSSRSRSATRDRRDQISSSDRASPRTWRALARVTEAGLIPAKTHVRPSPCIVREPVWPCQPMRSPAPLQNSPMFCHVSPGLGAGPGTREKLKKWSLGDWLALARSQ